jgi:hypothetical protein
VLSGAALDNSGQRIEYSANLCAAGVRRRTQEEARVHIFAPSARYGENRAAAAARDFIGHRSETAAVFRLPLSRSASSSGTAAARADQASSGSAISRSHSSSSASSAGPTGAGASSTVAATPAGTGSGGSGTSSGVPGGILRIPPNARVALEVFLRSRMVRVPAASAPATQRRLAASRAQLHTSRQEPWACHGCTAF